MITEQPLAVERVEWREAVTQEPRVLREDRKVEPATEILLPAQRQCGERRSVRDGRTPDGKRSGDRERANGTDPAFEVNCGLGQYGLPDEGAPNEWTSGAVVAAAGCTLRSTGSLSSGPPLPVLDDPVVVDIR